MTAQGYTDVNRPSVLMYMAALSSLLGAMCVGFVTSYNSPAQPSMEKQLGNNTDYPDFIYSKADKSLIGSLPLLGAAFGGVIAGPIAGKIGRRLSMMLVNIPCILGWFSIVFANSWTLLYFGRVMTGFGAGIMSGVVPMYAMELSPIHIRGLMGCSFQLFVMIGVVLCTSVGILLDWKQLAGFASLVNFAMPILIFFMPESPVYIYNKTNDDTQVEAILKKIRKPGANIKDEAKSIAASASQKAPIILPISEIVTPVVWKPLLMCLCLMAFQQFSGINPVLANEVRIFEDAGIKDETLKGVFSAIVNFIALVATAASAMILDKFGRRVLLLVSGTGHVAFLGLLAVHFSFGSSPSWVAIIGVVGFMISFALGYGPIAWLMVPEMTPFGARGFISAICTCFNWMCAFTTLQTYETLKESLGKNGVFIFFGVFCFISILFVKFILPETKGKSWPDMEAIFDPKSVSNNNDKERKTSSMI